MKKIGVFLYSFIVSIYFLQKKDMLIVIIVVLFGKTVDFFLFLCYNKM